MQLVHALLQLAAQCDPVQRLAVVTALATVGSGLLHE